MKLFSLTSSHYSSPAIVSSNSFVQLMREMCTCVRVVSFNFFQTYNVDRQVPDSAGTATALFSGVKANYYMVGLDATASFNVCQPETQNKAKVKTLIDWAIEAGKSTGKSFRLHKINFIISNNNIL